MISDNTINKLGFNHIARRIDHLCVSQPGRNAALRQLTFSTDYELVVQRLTGVDEMIRLIASADPFRLGGLSDLTAVLHAARPQGTFLAVEDLASLQASIDAIVSISGFFAKSEEAISTYKILHAIAAPMPDLSGIARLIDRTLDRFGQVKDTASPALADLRRSIASTQASVGSVMRRVMARAVEGGYLDSDTTPVVRSGRLVLPVSPMNKRRIPGIVHDESASGKTFYIEPAELVEANNRIRELQIEERREITRILREITTELRPQIDDIIAAIDIAGVFDFIRAKALYAREISAVMPHIDNECQLEWYHAVNPVLQASLDRHGKEAVPLDVVLTQQKRILIISGPNAGGKSVCLKTVGLLQMMLQSGLLPPVYENSHFGIFDNIFVDIGDDQSIEDDLSTYSSHLKKMNAFLRNATSSTLVLIDEFGAGTEPQIGGALAQAILKQLNAKRVWGVITTHYQNLKTFADETPGLVNGSMLYDRQLMQPLFRLSIGNAGSSFAIEIARKTGLPASIIEDAEQIVGSDYVNMDRFLLDIARDRRYWDNKRQAIRKKEKQIDDLLSRYETDADSLRTQRRDIIAEAREEARRIIAESNAAVERTIREIREAQAERERTKAIRARLAEERSALEADIDSARGEIHPLLKKKQKRQSNVKLQKESLTESTAQIQIGGNVKMEGQSTVGRVVDIQGKKAIVTFGELKVNVPLDKLTPTNAQIKSSAKASSFISSQTAEASRNRQLNFSQEIDLRGMRLDEALRQITLYIDDALQFNASRVRILHGTGTGALRQGIRQYLSTIDGVAGYRDELPQFGGAGVTIVDLV